MFYLETTSTIIVRQCLYYGCPWWRKLSFLCMHLPTPELYELYNWTSRFMRKNLMDYLLLHADNLSGNSMSLTWRTLAMMHASEIQSELRHKGFFEMLLFLLLITMLITWELPPRIDASMQTHQNYVWLLAGTPWILQCIRLTLAALSITLWFKNLLVIQCYQPLLCAHSSL